MGCIWWLNKVVGSHWIYHRKHYIYYTLTTTILVLFCVYNMFLWMLSCFIYFFCFCISVEQTHMLRILLPENEHGRNDVNPHLFLIIQIDEVIYITFAHNKVLCRLYFQQHRCYGCCFWACLGIYFRSMSLFSDISYGVFQRKCHLNELVPILIIIK